LLLAAVVAGCGGEPPADDGAYDNVMSFDTTSVQLIRQRDTLSLTVQLAVTPAQRSMGLMERQRLADNAGMLFVYDSTQPPDAGFWMYRTRIPLDIAFIDSTGVIRAIRSMTPCPTTIAEGCPTYAGDVPYRHALEVNAGFFAQHRLGVGDSVLIPDLAAAGGGSAGQPRPR
jgi:uncharacterized membrane protein (UPF0127 family)